MVHLFKVLIKLYVSIIAEWLIIPVIAQAEANFIAVLLPGFTKEKKGPGYHTKAERSQS